MGYSYSYLAEFIYSQLYSQNDFFKITERHNLLQMFYFSSPSNTGCTEAAETFTLYMI